MRFDRLKAFALAFPGTTVVKQWGEHLVFKVAGKMFLVVGVDGGTVDGLTIKCDPKDFDDLTDIDGITQAPYCAKRHWVRLVETSVMPEAQLKERIGISYDLVKAKLPKKTRAKLTA
jgi:predicted DNA-binding protein (MmcQ/YjbR family)